MIPHPTAADVVDVDVCVGCDEIRFVAKRLARNGTRWPVCSDECERSVQEFVASIVEPPYPTVDEEPPF